MLKGVTNDQVDSSSKGQIDALDTQKLDGKSPHESIYWHNRLVVVCIYFDVIRNLFICIISF